MNAWEKLLQHISEIEAKLNYTFKDKNLLALALVHRSFINENRGVAPQHNERLEFLGDSVLGLLIAEYLFKYMPSTPEGELSYLRSRLVEASSCVVYIQKLDVHKYLLLGKGERLNNGRGRESILADLFEAIFGAIYLDGGIDMAKRFLFSHFSPEIDAILKTPIKNMKAILQDFAQKKFRQAPVYKVISAVGPDHSKTFDVSVWIQNEEVGHGSGSSKKEAEQSAAADALAKMKKEV
jgi:ribonuclease-3